MRRSIFTTCLVVAAIAVLAPAAAEAHNSCLTHPADPSTACVRTDNILGHIYIDVCDRQADGNKVYARVALSQMYPWNYYFTLTGYDTNNSTAGCSTYDSWDDRFDRSPMDIEEYAICVQNQGCSLWRKHNGTLSNETKVFVSSTWPEK